MKPSEILTNVKLLDIDLYVEDEKLRYRAPKGVLTAEIKAEIKAHKDELIELLKPKPVPKAVFADTGARIRCQRCDDYTPQDELPCDYPQYAEDWLLYVCKLCGYKAYARKNT